MSERKCRGPTLCPISCFSFPFFRPSVDAPEAVPVMQQEIDLLSLSGSYGGRLRGEGGWPQAPVTVHRCGMLTSRRWQTPSQTSPPPHPALPLGLRRQKFVNGCRDCRHAWNSSGFPNNRVTRWEGESRGGERGRGVFSAKAIHIGMNTGANFQKIKAPSVFGGTQPFCSHVATRRSRWSKYWRSCKSKGEKERNQQAS